MKINIEKAKEEFLKYTETYDLTNPNIKMKQTHSLRVMKISEEIAKNIGLKEEEIELATLIGLLHDIARFEQYTQFNTYKDLESFDHGDYAIKILDKNIRKYINDNKYDNIIKKAIKNHNKFTIEEELTNQEMLFAKIIRDADKIDILYEAVYIFNKGKEEKVNKSILSEKVYNQFINRKLIKREKNHKSNYVDSLTGCIAFIYDINFKISFKILKEKDYINKILDRYNFQDKETNINMQTIRRLANEYIEEKINEKN